jgi:gliding motility-associated-like protein
MRIVLFLLLCSVATCLSAQQETANWFLTNNHIRITPGGIAVGNFNGPKPLFQPINVSTSVSDAAGNLLFASDGAIVVDRNFQAMPGLSTRIFAEGSNMIPVQIPNSAMYYIFYTTRNDYSDYNSSYTLRYLLIDMQLNGGKGAVVESEKIVTADASSGFTTVEDHSSGNLWLVAHISETSEFRSYQITSTGLQNIPVTSDAGTSTFKTRYIMHQLKTSPNGKMIGGMIEWRDQSGPFYGQMGWLEVFNFDGATGILTSKVLINASFGAFHSYHSIEFSPDNRLFYAGFMARVAGLQPCGYGSSQVMQFNLCYTDPADIRKYAMIIANQFAWCYPNVTWGRMQLGADKKIHLNYTGSTISGFLTPNRIGSSSQISLNEYNLSGYNNNYVPVPGFHHKVLEKATKNNIVYNGGCFPSTTTFSVTNDTISSIAWNFGDAASASDNVNALNPAHDFSAPGFYQVTADLFGSKGNLIESIHELVEIKDPAKRLLYEYGTDTAVCSGNGIMLKLKVVNGIFHWYFAGPDGIKHSLGTSDSLYIYENYKYFVEMRQNDCDGCIRWDSINLKVLPAPYTTLGYDKTICFGDSVRFSVSDLKAQHNWSDGSTGMSIIAKKPGAYWVKSEYNNNGCPVYDTVTLSVNPDISFEFGNDTVLCTGEKLLLSPGVAGTSPVWQDGSYHTAFNVTTAGKYWSRIYLNGCIKSDTINVAYVNAEAVSLGSDTIICQNDPLLLKPKVTNATLLWNDGSAGESISVSQAGKYWVRVNNGSCAMSDTISIEVTQRPGLFLGADTTVCEGQSLFLATGITNANYQWQDGSRNATLTVAVPGIKWVRVQKGGCSVIDSITVTHKPSPYLNLGNDTLVCANRTVLLDATNLSINNYRWQNNHTQPTYLVTTPGQYFLRATGLNGCFRDDTIMVYHKALPSFLLGGDTVICDNTAIRYSFYEPATNYIWSNGVTNGNNSISQPGLYWLQATQNNCVYRDSISVSTITAPSVYLGNDTAICETDAILLIAGSDPASYHWNTGASSAYLNVSRQGTYTVEVKNNGCIARDTIKISSLKTPRFSLGKDTSLCEGQTFIIQASSPTGKYLWQDGTEDRSYVVKSPGLYNLTVTNTCGSYSDEILVTRGVCQFVIPNAFTPNNDNNNDFFRLKNAAFIARFSMKIFNRWGQIVYSSIDPSKGWDGKQNTLLSPEGNYNWIITYTDRQGNTETKYGSVLLIR